MWQVSLFKGDHNTVSHLLLVLVRGACCSPVSKHNLSPIPWAWVGPVTALSNRSDGSDIVPVLAEALSSLAGSSSCLLEENHWGRRMTSLRCPCRERVASKWVKKPRWTWPVQSWAAWADTRWALCEFLTHTTVNKINSFSKPLSVGVAYYTTIANGD